MRTQLLTILIIFVLLAVGTSAGQNATLHGVVYDKNGDPAPGITILVENKNTGFSKVNTTDANGKFDMDKIPPADGYHVTASKEGVMWDQRSGISLNVSDERTILPPMREPVGSNSGAGSANAQGSGRPTQTPGPQSQEQQAPISKYIKSIFQDPVPSDQLTFLNHFEGYPTHDIIRDKQFSKLLKSVVPDCMFHYGRDMKLSDALEMVLKDSPLPVQVRDGRYVMVSGQSGPYLMGRGFIWIDKQEGIVLSGIYFNPTNGEPSPTFTVFSRQVRTQSLSLGQLPPAFAEDLRQWSRDSQVPPITTRYFITGSNRKILLEHDEFDCAPGNGPAALPGNACEQMNLDVADIDMNAAYYLDQTDHLPYATARMITGQDQVIWLQLREKTCRLGPDPFRCRVHMTRERTHVIIKQNPVPHQPHK